MRKAFTSTILSAALVGGAALPGTAWATEPPGPQGTTSRAMTASAALTPTAAAALRPALAFGVRGPAVVYVQRKLGIAPSTGYYGPVTRARVTALQKARKLRVTGTVDRPTWKVLLATKGVITLPAAKPATSPGAGTPALSPAKAAALKPLLSVGARGPAVVYVQSKLGVTPASGYFGNLTRSAVTTLQSMKGLRATGTVGPATWTVLLGAKGVIALPEEGAPPAPKPEDPTPTLTPERAAAKRPLLEAGMGPGDPAVVFVQRYLHVSPASGYYGTLTTAAVRAYQAGLGISATGKVGPLTWDAIQAGRTVDPDAPAPKPTTPSPGTIPTPKYSLPDNPRPGQIALAFALSQVGDRYVLGGTGPDVWDCSGLVQQAYLKAGVRLPRTASQQSFAGTRIPIEDIVPGDLLYYRDGSSAHISMYFGGDLVVEAANPRRGVRMRHLHESWYDARFVTAVHIG